MTTVDHGELDRVLPHFGEKTLRIFEKHGDLIPFRSLGAAVWRHEIKFQISLGGELHHLLPIERVAIGKFDANGAPFGRMATQLASDGGERRPFSYADLDVSHFVELRAHGAGDG